MAVCNVVGTPAATKNGDMVNVAFAGMRPTVLALNVMVITPVTGLSTKAETYFVGVNAALNAIAEAFKSPTDAPDPMIDFASAAKLSPSVTLALT
jgi:hypothetical protein